MKIRRLVIVVLPFALGCALFAQQSSSPRKNNGNQPAASRGSGSGGQSAATRQSQGITRTYVHQAPESDRLRPNHHPPRYHYNGGFAYYPYYSYPDYENTLSGSVTTPLNSMQTATDRVLANGGTFTLVDSAPGEVRPEVETPQVVAARQTPVTSTLPSTEFRSLPATSYAAPADLAPGVGTAVEQSPAILVFADGRRVEVQNYAVFGASVIVMGPQRQRVPLTQLDLQATLAANENAGYTFKIPAVYLK